jgi:putative RecB family exonuclease
MTHRSYSQRNEYLDCGWKYRLHRVVQLPEIPAVWFPAGSAFHEVAEAWAREDFNTGNPAPIEDWQRLFLLTFAAMCDDLHEIEPDESKWRIGGRVSKAAPNKEDRIWWERAGQDIVRSYILWRERMAAGGFTVATIDGVPCIEMRLESLIGKTEVVSYVDLVLRDPKGIPVVYDLKAGARVPIGTEQLGLYSVQLEPVLGEPVTWGAYYMARQGTATENKSLAHYTPENLGMIYDMLDKAIESEIFAPHIGMSCQACGYASACIWWGNAEPQGAQQ